ncbi:MAG: hypothetical protein QGG54_08435 [Gammaproteobacteria bacterium]|jgi:hypothetical protein|nr:hypothetical protein [Gammaproteobacteria bacterium]MDP6536968.1 hypothetical protein [Gammaproteobacteria bacterium]MDP6731541.1 hypothetical protein [Gammaproteobacteria bacterium]HAJ76179.1 hypothetical protein [Gammaproteobacteria bacterium]|tara:strand:- start:383 stop:1138 length:756 start_codon:yes stop_codon:yes gene_type:complete
MKTLMILLAALLSLPVLADVETETNNTESTADTLTSGELMSGNLSNDDDIDYFEFSLSGVETLELVFGSPNVMGTESQWLVMVQRVADGILIFQEALGPAAGSPVTRNIDIETVGLYWVIIRPPGGSLATPTDVYNLTIIPDNFTPILGTIEGVWQDNFNSYYSIHEGAGGLLYIELSTDPFGWTAYLGSRIENRAVLDLVVGPGTAELELTFTTNSIYEARYITCQAEGGGACAAEPGELLYTSTKVFAD